MRRLNLVIASAVLAAACGAAAVDAGGTPSTTVPPVGSTTTTAATTVEQDPCLAPIEAAVATLGELVRVYVAAQELDQASPEFAEALSTLESLDIKTQALMSDAYGLGCDDDTVIAAIDAAAAEIDAEFIGQFDQPVRQSALQAWAALGGATIDGAALPAYGQGDDAAMGMPIPDAAGRDLDGEPFLISADGHPKAIMFVAHWCPHCQDEVRELAPWLAAAELPGDVEVITVATGSDPSRVNYPPAAWFADFAWPLPVLDDRGNAVADAFGLSAYPYWVFVDSDGLVVSRIAGALGLDDIIAMLETLSAG